MFFFVERGMSRSVLVVIVAIGGAMLALHAQELAPSSVDLTPKPKEQNPPAARPTPTPASELPDLPELSQLDEVFKQTSLGKTADEFRVHIEWRRLRNRVANDPEVVAAKKAADAARTDLEKRELIRQYYKIYYARMGALTDRPEIKAALEDMKDKHVGLADQKRVRPSPSPAPTTAPETTPAPEAADEQAERPSPLESTLDSPSPTATPAEGNEP
jgi:hypothetical protein